MRVGVVGGTSLTQLVGDAAPVDVETPYGDVRVRWARGADGVEWVFLPRHGEGHLLPPHRVPYRANAWAMSRARVDRVLAVASVGALRADVPTGAFLVPDDYVDVSGRPDRSFHDDAAVHVDVSEAYCPEVRRALVRGARATGRPVIDGGVYAATPGPRFETRAEVRLLASVAHVVGMTGCPEAALMRELGLCYATLAVVANPAAGLGPAAIAARDVVAAARATEDDVRRALAEAVKAVPVTKKCTCVSSIARARVRA